MTTKSVVNRMEEMEVDAYNSDNVTESYIYKGHIIEVIR